MIVLIMMIVEIIIIHAQHVGLISVEVAIMIMEMDIIIDVYVMNTINHAI